MMQLLLQSQCRAAQEAVDSWSCIWGMDAYMALIDVHPNHADSKCNALQEDHMFVAAWPADNQQHDAGHSQSCSDNFFGPGRKKQ